MTDRHTPDPWERLRQYTPARIALGRAGTSLPTRELLAFQAHHARATDAVYAVLDRDTLAAQVCEAGLAPVLVESQARDRAEYLQRPDRGRALSESSRARLAELGTPPADVVIALCDGLSACAVERDGVPVLRTLAERLTAEGFTVGPVPIVQHGRVALQDEIGSLLGAQVIVSLIGERPGLLTPHSLGAYLVYAPRPGYTDARRNCLSNIHPQGLSPAAAADALLWLIREALRRQVSGVALKDDRAPVVAAVQRPLLDA